MSVLAAPSVLWRWNAAGRALVAGMLIGVALGVLAWLDSGTALAAAVVFLVTGGLSGVVTAHRMARDWPQAASLSRGDRVAVVRAVRRGEPLPDAALVEAALSYATVLHTAASRRSLWRYLLAIVVVPLIVTAIATALWDARYGSVGSAVASLIYLAVLPLEFLWWPRYTAALLRRADRSVGITPAS
jgi:hypothetical protein